MSNSSEAVKKWRKSTKERLLLAMGNKCVICGYDKCVSALDFHHVDPKTKSFSLASARGSIKNWKTLVEEVKKCVILCANCHREVHADIAKIPERIPVFLNEYENYKEAEKEKMYDTCPICGNKKNKNLITCSQKCANIKNRKIDWDQIDLEELYKHNSILKIGRMLGVSDNAVRKHLKKRNLL